MRAHDPYVGQRRALDPLELEMAVSHPLWVPGTQVQPSLRAVSSINC